MTGPHKQFDLEQRTEYFVIRFHPSWMQWR